MVLGHMSYFSITYATKPWYILHHAIDVSLKAINSIKSVEVHRINVIILRLQALQQYSNMTTIIIKYW
jgi:hypothetical protein